MKKIIIDTLNNAHKFIIESYKKIISYINSYEYNIPLIFAITGAVFILLLIIFGIIIYKKNKKIKELAQKTDDSPIPFKTERIKNKTDDNETTSGDIQTVALEEKEPQISEPIELVDEIVETVIEEEQTKDNNKEITHSGYDDDFVTTLKKDLEAEFINLIKREIGLKIAYDKTVKLDSNIKDRCLYILDKLDTLKEEFEFLEDYYLTSAVFYFYTETDEKALVILKEGLDKYPASSKLRIEASKILIQKQETETAREFLLKAKEINPSEFDAYLLLGEIYFKENRFSDALDIYKKVILLDPKNSTGFAYKGYLLAKKGFISEGERDLKKAISLNYKNNLAYYMLADIYFEIGNYSNAILTFKKALKFGCVKNDINRKLAIANYKIDKYAAVIHLLKKEKLDQTLKPILADSYLKLNLFDDALKLYLELFNSEEDTKTKNKYLDIIIDIYKKKNEKEHIAEYLKIKYELNENNLNILKELADFYYFTIKDIDAAREYYEKIIEKEKEFDSIYHLINIYFRKRDYKKCIELYKQIEKKEAIIPEIFYKVGLSFFKEKDFESAVILLSKAEITGWVDEELYNAIGYSNLKLKHFNKAEEAFKKALTINPYNFQIHNNLGTIYAQQENYKEAIKEFKEALNLEPNNKDIIYNLYKVYKILSESEAEKYLAKLEEVI